jgi:hypothetical protein
MSAVNREEIKQALQAIFDAHGGRATAAQVVEAAADPDSPLHPCFDWDDESAARSYRIEQARSLIRSVRVNVKTETTQVKTVAYVRDPCVPHGEQGYIATAVARTDEDLKREILVSEFSRAGSALRRARNIAASFDLEDEVDAIVTRVQALEDAVSAD